MLAMSALPASAAEGSPAARPLTYLALGDSYTIGEGVAPADRWPLQLVRDLGNQDIAVQAPRIIATTGWTTDELSSAIDDAGPLGTFDFVSLLIGVNNQYRGRPVHEYRDEFEALLLRSIRFAGGRADRVLVLGFPDWGATRFGRESGRDLVRNALEVDEYNRTARQACERHGVAFVDVADVSRAHGGENAMFTEDGLHPSAAMYQRWATLALPAARRALQETGNAP